MAKEACIQSPQPEFETTVWAFDDAGLERFAALIAAAEREACAKVCEDFVPTYVKNGERWLRGKNGKPDVRLRELAPELEAAWEAEQLLKNGSVLESYTVQHQCAAAIRARGESE
jgi:hypothetical protein